MQIASTRILDSGRLVGDIIQFGLQETATTPFVIANPTANVTTPAGTASSPTVVIDPATNDVSHSMYINLNEATAGLYVIGWLYNVGAQQIARLENVFVTWTGNVFQKVGRLINSTTLTPEDVDTAMYQAALVTPGVSDLPIDAILHSYSNLPSTDKLLVDDALILLAAAWLNGFTETEVSTGSLIASVRGTDETRFGTSTRGQNPLSVEDQWTAKAYEFLALTTTYGAKYQMTATDSIVPVRNRHVTDVDFRNNTSYLLGKSRWRCNRRL